MCFALCRVRFKVFLKQEDQYITQPSPFPVSFACSMQTQLFQSSTLQLSWSPSTMADKDVEDDSKFRLRSYQEEMLDASLRGNVIVKVPCSYSIDQ
jgi:hypothetical protein